MNRLHSFAIPAPVGTQEPLDIMSNNQPRTSLRNRTYDVHMSGLHLGGGGGQLAPPPPKFSVRIHVYIDLCVNCK